MADIIDINEVRMQKIEERIERIAAMALEAFGECIARNRIAYQRMITTVGADMLASAVRSGLRRHLLELLIEETEHMPDSDVEVARLVAKRASDDLVNIEHRAFEKAGVERPADADCEAMTLEEYYGDLPTHYSDGTPTNANNE